MWESIVGMLIGTSLVVGGFHFHDVNYRPSDGSSLGSITDPSGETYAIGGSYYNSPDEQTEILGYTIGAVGTAIFALSVKRAWQIQNNPGESTTEALRKFRQKINKKQIAGLALGLGIFIAGAQFHDGGYRHDGIPYKGDRLDLDNIPSNTFEHFGYFIGATGSAIFGLSLTHTW